MKSLLCLAIAASLNSCATVPQPARAPYAYDEAAVFPIVCGEGDRSANATAFRIGPNRVVTADHAVAVGPCRAEFGPLEVVRRDTEGDITELRSATPGVSLPFNCQGFQQGRTYLAVGYIWSRMFYRLQLPLIATVLRNDGLAVLVGQIERGMSGGMVINEAGQVVGINNRHSPASSRALADSFLCRQ